MFSYTNFESIVKESGIDWEEIAYEMKKDIFLYECDHSLKRRDFFAVQYGCQRVKDNNDLCYEPSCPEYECVSWLSEYFRVSNTIAYRLLLCLEYLGTVSIYECGAVFFHK